MTTKRIIFAAIIAGLAAPAAAQQAAPQQGIAIQDVRMQLFLERSGTLSENIVGSKKKFHNTLIGEGDAGEPSEAVLVTLAFQGPKNSKGSDKIARDLAQVKVTQSAKAGNKILLNRVYGGFLFGESGLAHKAFLVDNATCAPLEVEVKIGRSRKVAKVDFKCGE